MIKKKKVLLVFIHGFLGSDESFQNFPQDLKSKLSSIFNYNDGNNNQQGKEDIIDNDVIELAIYPRYDTKGDNRRAVQQLVDWLLLNATTVYFEKVVLLAHSMGGLLAADAYRYLYLHKPLTKNSRQNSDSIYDSTPEIAEAARPANNNNNILFSGLLSTLGSGWFYKNTGNIYSKEKNNFTTTKKAMNTGTYDEQDSPVEHILIEKYDQTDLPPLVNPITSLETRLLVNIAGIITFDSPFYGLHPGISLTGIGKAVHLAKQIATPTSLAAAGTALAVGYALRMYVSMPTAALTTTATTITSTVATWAAEEARNHLEFLYPLSDSSFEKNNRVKSLIQDDKVLFKCLYLSIPKIVPAETTEVIKHRPSLLEQHSSQSNGSVNNNFSIHSDVASNSQHRHFCAPPPEETQHIFSTFSSSYSDEIDAHMNIFEQVNDQEYIKLLTWSISNISELLLKTNNSSNSVFSSETTTSLQQKVLD